MTLNPVPLSIRYLLQHCKRCHWRQDKIVLRSVSFYFIQINNQIKQSKLGNPTPLEEILYTHPNNCKMMFICTNRNQILNVQ